MTWEFYVSVIPKITQPLKEQASPPVTNSNFHHMMFKHLTSLTALIALPLWMVSPILAESSPTPALIPLPLKYEATGNTRTAASFHVQSKEADFKATVSFCKTLTHLAKNTKSPIPVEFKKDRAIKNPEGYQLTVPAQGPIIIAASTPAGAFYGFQTLQQLPTNGKLPVCAIEDAPRFHWRGLMLDEARHFMGKAYVKHLLRTMAAHKLNKFHWHLTDDQGWRIEIKAYPQLTKIGAWRGPGTQALVPKWDKELPLAKKKYGGFYTQKDIKEIVAYANSLHIEIMPEIDVPGHAMAIALSYPQVLPKTDKDTGKGVHNLSNNVLSVVNPDNYRMLDEIFGEIAALFPSPYIHVGGDEVNVNAWKASPEHRTYMEKHGMKNPHQLQNMFMLRLEKTLKAHGKTLMGWNEIMHGGHLSKDTGIMAWISIGAGINAAKQGYPTVMAVGPHNYFDMTYGGPNEPRSHWWAGAINTQRAYDWNPLFADQLNADQQKNILGVHCCLWTEFITTTEDADYKLWPRACATAEVGWTQQEKRNWEGFSNRLGRHLSNLDALNVRYRVKPPQPVINQGEITIKAPYVNAPSKTLYTLDGTDPEPGKAKTYNGEKFDASDAGKLRSLTLRPTGRMSKIVKGAIQEPVGKWNQQAFGKEDFIIFDITKILTTSGNWIAEIKYQKGKDPLDIESLSVLENGKTIATAEGSILDNKHRTLRLRLPIKEFHSDAAPYQLGLKLKKGTGKNSRGVILFDRSVWIEPTTTVETNVPHHGENTVAKAANWTRSDWFWSNRQGKKGDQWTFTFDDPTKVTTINLPTGKPNTNDDIIVDATIEVSQDGKSFKKLGGFAYGTGKVKFKKPTAVKAIRVTLNADHQTWIIVRDPEIK